MTVRAWVAELRYRSRQRAAKAGLWALATSGVAVIAAMTLWWPTQHLDRELKNVLGGKRMRLIEVQQAEEMIQRYTHAQKMAPLLESKLSKPVTQAQLVESLGRLARKLRVKILTESYDGARNGSGEIVMRADLSVQGSYRGTRNFISDLATLPMWVDIQEVRLEGVRGTSLVKGHIRIVTYRGDGRDEE